MDRIAIVVAPFTGVWIETKQQRDDVSKSYVAPFTGVWIETEETKCKGVQTPGRALHGRVD